MNLGVQPTADQRISQIDLSPQIGPQNTLREKQRRLSSIVTKSYLQNSTSNLNINANNMTTHSNNNNNFDDTNKSKNNSVNMMSNNNNNNINNNNNNNNLFGSDGGSQTNKRNVINPNTLSVNQSRMTHRKSIVGRQERSEIRAASFQAQRLSDVGIAVGQQITAKMGLKLPASQERVVEQTRWLYLRYLFDKLRQKSLPLRDLNLTKSLQARREAALGLSSPKTLPVPVIPLKLSVPSISSKGPTQVIRRTERLRRNVALDDVSFASDTRTRFAVNTLDTTKGIRGLTQDSNSILGRPATSLPSRKYIMDPTINNQILAVIMKFVNELHDAQPELYDDTICELIGIDKFSSLEDLLEVQKTICQEMIRSEISWSRIVALFSLFGAMSLDCVRLGCPENVGPLIDGFIGFIERDLSLWISQQGGWESFLYKYRTGVSYTAILIKAMILSLPLFILGLIYLI